MANCARCGKGTRPVGKDGLCGGCRLTALAPDRQRYHFTEAMNEQLKAAYFGGRQKLTASITGLARRYPAIPRKQWLAQAKRIGVATTGRFRRWTPAEDAYLAEHAGQISMRAIARKLGRSREAVEGRAERLEISRRRSDDSYCVSDLVKGFGAHYSVVKLWMERGLLGKVHECQGLRVTGDNVVRFMRLHPHEYDLRRVDQAWYKAMLFGGVKEVA